MSAQATFSNTSAPRRVRALETIAACGPVALALVGIGGLAFGIFVWYAAITHLRAGNTVSEIALLASLALGVCVVFGAWYAYGHYFARRAGVGLVTALRWDAPSWSTFVLYPLGLFAPIWLGSPARSAGIVVALFSLVKLLVAARFVHTVRDVLTTFVVTRLPIIVIAELASIVIAQRPGTHVAESSNPLLAVWGRWDAVHYLDISERGYYGTDMAFFPLYPLLIHGAARFVGSALIAGLLISNVAFFFGLLYFYKLVEHQYTRAVAHRAIFYVSIFPTAIFFSAVYTESLFFALTVASFYYIREHKWVVAGAIGALAALTRSEGVLLVVPFAIEVIAAARSTGWRRFLGEKRRLARVAIGLALTPLGLVLYMGWLWVLRGDPLYFSHVQIHWNRHLAPPWVSFVHAFKILSTAHASQILAGESIELAFTLLMIAVFFAGIRRLRPSFSAYMALSILVPLSTSSLMSMPRFALVLFPMFVVLALWGSRSAVNNAVVAFSLPLLGLFTVLFVNWYWVA
ncbi:MAG: glycosyltransferase family 39 protein [Candidatus Eremiobacteraeota bacterium]|nr:glycosyltransferase family 39 protein [Candidatus Eremiobacteraeota bacterium]